MQQRFRWTSPRATALLILRAWLGEPAPTSSADQLGLTEHQQHAASRLHAALRRRRGAILADSVGLGKTFVALELMRAALDTDDRVLVIAPAALRAHWRKHLARLGQHDAGFTTHTALSNGRTPAIQPDLIVIDEAHAFRNPRTRRYRTLQRFRQDARVLLLTATPINNSAEDLYHLIRLFARDDAFRDLGIADLGHAFRAQSRAEVDRVLQDILVRRTRAHVRAERALAFPERAPPVALRYDADWPAALYDALAALTFAPYALESAGPAELIRLHLLKRLESSVSAFRSSIRTLRASTELFVAGNGFGPRLPQGDDWMQLSLPVPLHECAETRRGAELRQAALADAKRLASCASAVRRIEDAKLGRLIDLLEQECADAKVLIFSQYADTATYLWKQLYTRFRVGLVTGTDTRLGANRAARSTVIESFAPRANGRRTQLHARLQVDVLIATDVLSEGLNLQDANVVVNYEIPWNPVTLMQRVGRIDRLGSPHSHVRVYNFVPERGLDRLLGLMERVEGKLATIERIVGGDHPVLNVPGVGAARRAVEQSLFQTRESESTELASAADVEALRAELNGDHADDCSSREPVAASVTGKCDRTLIALRWRGAVRVLLCDERGIREDFVEAAALLRHALRRSEESALQPLDVSAALAWLQAEQHTELLRSPGATEAQRAAALKLLDIARTLPADRARRAEKLLRSLARPLPVEAQASLAVWTTSSVDAATACKQLEGILRNQDHARVTETNAQVIGVLRVFTGGAAPAHPE